MKQKKSWLFERYEMHSVLGLICHFIVFNILYFQAAMRLYMNTAHQTSYTELHNFRLAYHPVPRSFFLNFFHMTHQNFSHQTPPKTDYHLYWFACAFNNKHLSHSLPEICASATRTDLATSEGHKLLGHVGKATRWDLVSSQGRGMAICCVKASTHQHHIRVEVLEKRGRGWRNRNKEAMNHLPQNRMRTSEMTRMRETTSNEKEEDEMMEMRSGEDKEGEKTGTGWPWISNQGIFWELPRWRGQEKQLKMKGKMKWRRWGQVKRRKVRKQEQGTEPNENFWDEEDGGNDWYSRR